MIIRLIRSNKVTVTKVIHYIVFFIYFMAVDTIIMLELTLMQIDHLSIANQVIGVDSPSFVISMATRMRLRGQMISMFLIFLIL
jgi:hypothetical protein